MQLKLLVAVLVSLVSVSGHGVSRSNATAAGEGHWTASQPGSTTNAPDAAHDSPVQSPAQHERIRPLLPGSGMRPVRAGDDHIYGRADAAVNLVTYMDFSCVFCRRFWPVLQRAVNDAGGDINWVFRHFPLTESVDDPMPEALAAECAAELRGEPVFWQFTKALLTVPRRLTDDPLVPVERAALKQGLDWPQLQACIERGNYRERILGDRANAVQMGVAATPSTVLVRGNATLLVEGAVTTAQLAAALLQLDELSSSRSAP